MAGGRTGGGSVRNIIDYITIATTGNATDFGDLSVARYDSTGLSNTTKAFWWRRNTLPRCYGLCNDCIYW